MRVADFAGRRVLVTGHTGFKGAWLVAWLSAVGARVTGFAHAPETEPNLWSLLDLDGVTSVTGDLNDRAALDAAIADADPEFVFHLAAQSLVRRSYREPVETFATNVVGTVQLLDALRAAQNLVSVIVATSDKAYENVEQVWGYRHAADTRLVNVHVQRLRSKVEHDPENPEIVVTVRGVGYKAGTV